MSKEVPEPSSMPRKAVALLSGGLDSALAIHLIKRQGIDVIAVHYPSFFAPLSASGRESALTSLARQLEVPLIFREKDREEFLDIIRNPRYGLGKNLNPCIDCRIYTFIKSKELMKEIAASFIVTGEVVGQRPMSQRREAMKLIDRRSDCEGIVLRPLSALLLEPTVPEREGVVDREQLLGVAGRGRKIQLKMAEELGLRDYSTPAGGCLLTDKNYSKRLRDLLDDSDHISQEDLDLLLLGRHFRAREGLKMVVGRNETENDRLERIALTSATFVPLDFPGPVVVVRGRPNADEEILIARLLRRYGKKSFAGATIEIQTPETGKRSIKISEPLDDDWLFDHLI